MQNPLSKVLTFMKVSMCDILQKKYQFVEFSILYTLVSIFREPLLSESIDKLGLVEPCKDITIHINIYIKKMKPILHKTVYRIENSTN